MPEELAFAIEQFERNCEQARMGRRLPDAILLDMLSTNIDFYRRHLGMKKGLATLEE